MASDDFPFATEIVHSFHSDYALIAKKIFIQLLVCTAVKQIERMAENEVLWMLYFWDDNWDARCHLMMGSSHNNLMIISFKN